MQRKFNLMNELRHPEVCENVEPGQPFRNKMEARVSVLVHYSGGIFHLTRAPSTLQQA
jgi:hypothetical protein